MKLLLLGLALGVALRSLFSSEHRMAAGVRLQDLPGSHEMRESSGALTGQPNAVKNHGAIPAEPYGEGVQRFGGAHGIRLAQKFGSVGEGGLARQRQIQEPRRQPGEDHAADEGAADHGSGSYVVACTGTTGDGDRTPHLTPSACALTLSYADRRNQWRPAGSVARTNLSTPRAA